MIISQNWDGKLWVIRFYDHPGDECEAVSRTLVGARKVMRWMMIDSIDARKDAREKIEQDIKEYLDDGGEITVDEKSDAEVRRELGEKYQDELRRLKKR